MWRLLARCGRAAARGCKNLIAVTLGTGVGGGIIVNGEILTGAVGAGGEIGHMHVEDNETERCGCGNTGCLEEYASATGVVRLARRALRSCEDPSVLRNVPEEKLSAKKYSTRLRMGTIWRLR